MKQLIILIIIVGLAGCFGAEPQKTGLEGKPLPEFSLLLADSTTWLHTRDIPDDKSIALIYFSPFCPYCKAQTIEIIEDMDKLKDIQFYFITGFPLHDLRNFNKEYHLEEYKNITTGVDVANFVSNYFEIAVVPYIAIYSKDKKLQKAFVGKAYSGQLKRAAEK